MQVTDRKRFTGSPESLACPGSLDGPPPTRTSASFKPVLVVTTPLLPHVLWLQTAEAGSLPGTGHRHELGGWMRLHHLSQASWHVRWREEVHLRVSLRSALSSRRVFNLL